MDSGRPRSARRAHARRAAAGPPISAAKAPGRAPFTPAGRDRSRASTPAGAAAASSPPELRGRGFAGAVTAAVSVAARAFGAREVVLFADLSNATGNALYRRVGYRAVEDHVVREFDAAEVAGHGM
ncbi:GNAT family N-acetyltransferase [Streptomyces sp. NRRL S-337]|uniref:GNAT family N-acetyltransferase n=1 Tax=Streptomyces sp. NRRL S-337 TaxID=1463900 RepID=UPI000D144442